jgi:hypothetical protein
MLFSVFDVSAPPSSLKEQTCVVVFAVLHLCPPCVVCVCEAEHIKKRQLGSHAPMQRTAQGAGEREREIRCGHNYWFSLVRPFELLMSIVLSVTWRPQARSHCRFFAITIFSSVFRTASVPEQISVCVHACHLRRGRETENFNCSLKRSRLYAPRRCV